MSRVKLPGSIRRWLLRSPGRDGHTGAAGLIVPTRVCCSCYTLERCEQEGRLGGADVLHGIFCLYVSSKRRMLLKCCTCLDGLPPFSSLAVSSPVPRALL